MELEALAVRVEQQRPVLERKQRAGGLQPAPDVLRKGKVLPPLVLERMQRVTRDEPKLAGLVARQAMNQRREFPDGPRGSPDQGRISNQTIGSGQPRIA